MARDKKKLVEGVDFEFVKGKNTNAMVRNIFSKAEKAERAAKTVAVNKPATAPTTKPKAKPVPTKPKARPAGLNPQSGASRSTAGKVAAKESVSGASRSVAGKVPPKTSTAQQKAAYGANRPTSMDGVSRKAVEKPKPKTYAKKPFDRLKEFLAGGGMSGADKRKKAAEKAAKERR